MFTSERASGGEVECLWMNSSEATTSGADLQFEPSVQLSTRETDGRPAAKREVAEWSPADEPLELMFPLK